jgi:hypothetical protein
MRSARGYLLRAGLVVLLLTANVPAVQTVCAQPSSTEPVVELSVSEADSILKMVDDLEVELWEARALARQDSLYYEELLRLRAETYENVLQAYKGERPGWLERFVKQPVVWLAVGMWLGVQAK